jgi:dolichol-phosphate mannosyltransferase
MDVSIIVPTYEEPGIGDLLERLDAVAHDAGIQHEAVVVDDSPRTETVDRATAARTRSSVRAVHRPSTSSGSWGGLSGAVIDGLRLARAGRVIVMDGDGQHPPEVVPSLVHALDDADLVVASRYLDGGQATGLADRYRRTVSSACTSLARGLFYSRVGRRTTDPMTGFFALRVDALDTESVAQHAVGFKVLLAILVTHRGLAVREVPFVFGERATGESKASWRNGAAFVRQIAVMRMTA